MYVPICTRSEIAIIYGFAKRWEREQDRAPNRLFRKKSLQIKLCEICFTIWAKLVTKLACRIIKAGGYEHRNCGLFLHLRKTFLWKGACNNFFFVQLDQFTKPVCLMHLDRKKYLSDQLKNSRFFFLKAQNDSPLSNFFRDRANDLATFMG